MVASAGSATPRWTWPAWCVVAAVLAWVPHALGFEFKDGDSDLYAELSRQLSQAPFSQWLSPQWPVPAWPAYLHKHGVFEEHMAFFFWPAALLGKLGVPPVPAALWCNALYLVGILAGLSRLSTALFDRDAARLSMAAWLFSYAGIHHLTRNNHEMPLALLVLCAVLCVTLAPTGRRFLVYAALCGAGCVAMKGLVGAVVLPSLLVWAWCLGGGARRWSAVLAAALGAVLLVAVHDVAFEAANGHSFVRAYLDIHLGYAADREQPSPIHKLTNLAYYAGVVVVWAAPASVVVLVHLFRQRRARQPLAVPLRAVLLTVVVYVVFFSVFDRRASRYVFSCLPLVMLAAGPALLEFVQPRLRTWLPRMHLFLMGSALILMLGRVYVHNRHHHFYSPNNPQQAAPRR